MKTITLLSLGLLISFSLYSYNPVPGTNDKSEIQQIEFNEILDDVLDIDENRFVAQLEKQNKIVIIDNDFNKIREESVDKVENLTRQSMLVPIIYRSQFITKLHNVSYYMLEEK